MSNPPIDPLLKAVGAATRRDPVQHRSLRTVARILDAASSLLTRLPFEEVTTKRIAAEPGVSVGALYRFFPDKQSIIDAVTERHIRQLRAEVERDVMRPMLQAPLNLPNFNPAVVLDRMIDAYIVYLDTHPDFRTISFGREPREVSWKPNTAARTGLVPIVSTLLFERLALALTPELELKLRVASEAGERLIAYAHEQPTRERRDLITAELKKMLARYLFSGNWRQEAITV
ncbi:MAG: TetR/AcrR family transcriptional regulator [Candidatus Korobacteraceae bacterium]